jgi:hypothetical protein
MNLLGLRGGFILGDVNLPGMTISRASVACPRRGSLFVGHGSPDLDTTGPTSSEPCIEFI